jgi:BRCA1-associated protein
MNAMALEYSYLLTSQLDSQRMYYEDRMNEALEQLSLLTGQCKDTTTELDSIHAENHHLEEDNRQATQQMALTKKDNARLVQKVAHWKDKTDAMHRNYVEEKEVRSCHAGGGEHCLMVCILLAGSLSL